MSQPVSPNASATSSAELPSTGFERLHPAVKRWVWQKQWAALKPIQEQTIALFCDTPNDILISAPTAGGKTEAIFLPLASELAEDTEPTLRCLCISPLKALINDQHQRLQPLFETIGHPLTKWHGDVPQRDKKHLLRTPDGALIITPESLEAMLIHKSTLAARLFNDLRYIVIDELHAFIGTERGRHMQSLLHRIARLAEHRQHRIRRIGLSATLGDLEHAGHFLQGTSQSSSQHQQQQQQQQQQHPVHLVKSDHSGPGLRMQLRGYLVPKPQFNRRPTPSSVQHGQHEDSMNDVDVDHEDSIADHLFRTLRGSDHLVFANSRKRTEELASALRHRADSFPVPNEFFPHHGSLSTALRHFAENRLKDPNKPTTVLCTSTLELGIDVGSVTSIAQIGTPPSVASLRQRLGRSGRGEDPAILRLYIEEHPVDATSGLYDQLRFRLVESIAICELLLQGWYEPQNEQQLHLSTLIHQIFSTVAQHGGIHANTLYQLLCQTGPFQSISSASFGTLLRTLGQAHYVTQTGNRELVLGDQGEYEVGHYRFYPAFTTPTEYRIVHDSHTLGTMPVDAHIHEDQTLTFAGRWWIIREINHPSKIINVTPAEVGLAPVFGGSGFTMHPRIRQEMLHIYSHDTKPRYLNPQASTLLAEARHRFQQNKLQQQPFVPELDGTNVVLWTGDREMHTLQLLLETTGHPKTRRLGALLFVPNLNQRELQQHLRSLLKNPIPLTELAERIKPPPIEKYDHLLPPNLAAQNFASQHLSADIYHVLQDIHWA